MKKSKSVLTGLVLAISALNNTNAQAITLFSDGFEAGLSQWTGFNGVATSGYVVSDPLGSGSHVLSFSGVGYLGDSFTLAPISVTGTTSVKVRFDYLGKAVPGSIPDNFGGFVGLATTLTEGSGGWIAGTLQSAVNGAGFVGIHIIDDGNWHSYEVDVTSVIQNNSWSSIYLKFEDWGDGGPVGDVFFDNVSVVATVPEPTACALLLTGGLAFLVRIKKHEKLR
jgi:hypothetical protein